MKEFLRQVSDHYIGRYASEGSQDGIGRCCFVFPNRRSQVFFGKYLGEGVRELGRPIVAPKMLTINDFFAKVSGRQIADRVDQLLALYDCYREINPKAEPLDEFIFWGDVLLADFDDVDKYRVDPEQLFRNVAALKDLEDNYSYLTENQRKAVEHFIGHFRKEGRLTVNPDADAPNVKEKFLRTWNLLLPLYQRFRNRLATQGMAYEGMVYRELADSLEQGSAAAVLAEPFPGTDLFVFTGLNALNGCEKAVLRKLRDASLAEFCWDYSSAMIRDPRNKSSYFMNENIREFPPRFELDSEGLPTPRFEVIRVPSSTGQAKLVPGIVRDREDVAIVLPDEQLLIPVLNSIPPAIRDINVTMGYPMRDSAFFAFMQQVSAMQLHLRQKDGQWYYYHRQVWSLFSSSLFRKVTVGDEAVEARVKAIKKARKYYIPQEELSGIPVFDLLFRPAVTNAKEADAGQIERFCTYQKELIRGLAEHLTEDPELSVELAFARAYYNAVNRLQEKSLRIMPLSYARLLEQLLGPVSVPFNGEPLKGLQILGPLETRALDFRNLVILSCNEGVFPRRSVSASFIPPELRKGFTLPTYEYQDAVRAYYFYRMIQRAEQVYLIYDSRTEGIKSGEESRYIKQLEYHFNLPLNRSFVKAEAKINRAQTEIPKKETDVKKIREAKLSASTLNLYLDCPARFYYSKVVGLTKSGEVSEDLDPGMLGTVYHAVMQELYDREFVTRDYAYSWTKRRRDIQSRVRSGILAQLNALEVTGRDLVVERVIVEYVLRTLRRDLELMDKYGVEGFSVLGVERKLNMTFDGFSFTGVVDRMDSFVPGQLRIIDYKTGKVEDKELRIRDDNAEDVVEALFRRDKGRRPQIALQIFLYDYMVGQSPEAQGMTLVNSIYQPAKFFTDGVLEVPMSPVFNALMEDRLRGLLAEMVDLRTGFVRTEDAATCAYCDFKLICGR
ncbi:MAG: hypothetical protein GX125_05300 [Bacteroidales bacterium]|jgi:hypothetical protein|nr:PD-(D/E)XK nuclease family protein [Bacteroidota bacterium]NLN99662.1 hypothetical protein [Bacteroidales bacterium]